MKYMWLYIVILLLIFCPLIANEKKKKIQIKKIIKRKKQGEENQMKILAQNFINKYCLIHILDDVVEGTIMSITEDNGMEVETKNGIAALNLEYVIKIEEWPVNKKGKRKAIW